jgi:nucleoside-diphosphate-sugar epimerase
MNILITGNLGYVGSALVRYLKKTRPDYTLIGFDAGYFSHALTGINFSPEVLLHKQYYGDVRNFDVEYLENINAVVHLAAISNDPMGNEFEKVTFDINHRASVDIARMAHDKGVKNFVFASSCSMYGQSEGGAKKESDTLNPLTAYAKSKIAVEKDISEIGFTDMLFTSLRFSTACGMSGRLRLDLVLNDFVACASSLGEISILSDGSPWRPLIDVEDMARSILWALERSESEGGTFLAVNAGRDENNYQVKDLADSVMKEIKNTTIKINHEALPDKRSYKVDFSLYKSLAHDYLPQVSVNQSIKNLAHGLRCMNFSDINFRSSLFMRLNMLKNHIGNGHLDTNLFWKV